MLRVADIAPFLRKKTVRFADEEPLWGRSRGALVPLWGRPERQVSRWRARRLPAAAPLCLVPLALVLLWTWLLVSGPAGPAPERHLTYAAWRAQHRRPEAAEETPASFRGQPLQLNASALVHVRWKGDPECQHLVVRFANQHQLPSVALVSMPGSGVTWLRYLIEGGTGVFTGSVHHDQELFRKGFLGEMTPETDGSTVVQQTHRGPHVGDRSGDQFGNPLDFEAKAAKTIVLLRDPYRALLHARSLQSGLRDEMAPSAQFRGPGWVRFVRAQLQQWSFRLQLALGISQQVHLLHYEDIQEDPERQLVSVLEFLEISRPSLARLRCLRDHPAGLTRRSFDAAVVADYAYSEPSLRQLVDEHLDQMNEMLLEHGLVLPLEKYPMYMKRDGQN